MEATEKLPVFTETAPYTIPTLFYQEGFRAFQKRFVMRRNTIMMLIFFVLLISFVVASIQDPTNQISYILCLVCVAAIFMLWYNPRKQRRCVIDAIRELEEVRYTAACDGKVLRIRTEQQEEEDFLPETRVSMETAWIKHFAEFYLVCDEKKMFYILPEKAIGSTVESAPEQIAAQEEIDAAE